MRSWLIIPTPDVKEAVQGVQRSFGALEWVAPVPQDFLHVGASTSAAEWGNVAPFSLSYRRVNCFHDAAIVEVHADNAPFPPPPFLPHLSVGYFRRSERPGALRDALVSQRDVELGTGLVEEILVCDVPIAKSRFFEPWRIVATVRLEG